MKRQRMDEDVGSASSGAQIPSFDAVLNGGKEQAQPLDTHKNRIDLLNEGAGESQLYQLYEDAAEEKIWAVAKEALTSPEPPRFYPEYTVPGGTEYVYRDLQFWTSGFFPGSLHLLLERRRKYQHITGSRAPGKTKAFHELQLEAACKLWTENLDQNAYLTGTHDLGFMIMPWAKLAWELNRDHRAFMAMKGAANTLLSRFDPKIGCMRSWDKCMTKKYNFDDPQKDFLMIIDNMMNLNVMFYVAAQTGDKAMYAAAVQHARTTQRTHIREDSSTTHVVVFDPETGNIKERLTNQGYAHGSCWSRGQAWALAGFAETYAWTRDPAFLRTATACADYFLGHLPASGIPPWDFDAPPGGPPDTSAAMIAAYGMLLLHQARAARGGGEDSKYLGAALRLVHAVCSRHLNAPAEATERRRAFETVEFGVTEQVVEVALDARRHGQTILNGATINNYEFAPRRWADHGLVYADYFFLLVGNKLLEMGIGANILRLKEEGGSGE
ncbi:Six-hairpin glycosidase-like protein [Xylariomycetidae sp. FL0641]|nr:Six-hairpin glycosidase-like protein [Xylariomycetidae sp. FL0641]